MHFNKNFQDNHYKRLFWDNNYFTLLENEKYGLKRMFKFLEAQKDQVLKKVEHLTKISAAPSPAVSTSIHFCIRRFASLLLFIAKGIFGMLMGLYNKRQQAHLRAEMRSTLAEQRQLIHMLQVQQEASMDPIKKRLKGIQYELQSFDLATANNLLVQILNFENEIVTNLIASLPPFNRLNSTNFHPYFFPLTNFPAWWKN